jgi:hypothetical protein
MTPQRRRSRSLAGTGVSLNTLHAVSRTENVFHHGFLRTIEMGLPVGRGNCLRAGKDRHYLASSFTDPAEDFLLCFDRFCGR